MAALANIGANLVWQTVRIALAGANEMTQLQFKALRTYLATQGKNPKLQFLAFTDTNVTTAGGIQLGTGTPVVWAVWVKKGTTSTASYIKINDDATDDTTAGNQRIVLPLLSSGDEAVYIYNNSAATTIVPKAWANGIVVGADTTVNGTTDTTALDAGNGFVLVG